MPPVPGCTHLPVSIPREMGPFQETRLLGSPGGRSVPRGEQQLLGRRRSINRSSSGGDNACLPSISLTQSLHAHIRGTSWRFRGCRRVDGLGTIPNLAIGASFPGYLVSSNNGEKWAGGSITHYLPIRSTVLRSVRRYETILLPRISDGIVAPTCWSYRFVRQPSGQSKGGRATARGSASHSSVSSQWTPE